MWILWFFLSIPMTEEYSDSMERDFLTWTANIQKLLGELRTLTGESTLRSAYKKSAYGKLDITEEVAFQFLDKAVQKINTIVKEKSELVHKLKLSAEEAFRTRTHKEPPKCYIRAKAIKLTPTVLPVNTMENCSEKLYLDMEQNALFENTYVSMNNSVAHVPTNVYDLSETIVAVGNWTAALDNVFRENAAVDHTLKWQYFGSSTGFFRFYPGSMWDIQLDELRLDFFDCRSQPWYLSASSYAKEVLILVDRSGSMKGRSNIISNATVTEILNTLTDNDFFNVITFTDTPQYVDSAIRDRLVQAFKYNKDRVMKRFTDLKPNGTANYEKVLIEAFSLLNKTNEYYDNSKHCNKILMVITDSVPDSYKQLLEKLNPDKNVRIFVYLLGQHSYAEPYVEELACSNRGYAVTIATLADVKENVLKYLDVIARSNALLNHGFITWSGVTVRQFNLKKLVPNNFNSKFEISNQMSTSIGQDIKLEKEKIDTMIASKEEEPVTYTSVAEAVYDRTKKSMRQKKGNLLGVAGIDVGLQSFRDALRGWEIGVNNYLFAVDNNGFILFHPNYRPVYKATLKSYYQNVDLNEVEIPSDVKIDPSTGTPEYNTPLRNTMVGRERKVNQMDTNFITDNFHTTFQAAVKYFSMAIDQTPFTLGLAVHWNSVTDKGYPIPSYPGTRNHMTEKLQKSEMNAFAPIYAQDHGMECNALINRTKQGSTLSPYRFCQFDKHLAALWNVNPICAFRYVLLDKEVQNAMKCDLDYLHRVWLDAKETQEIQKFWSQQEFNSLVPKWGVQQAFSFHHTGLIRFYNFTDPVYANFISDHILGVEDPLYAETVLAAQYFESTKLLVFHPPPNDLFRHFSSKNMQVPISVTTAVYNDLHQVPMAVAGLQITHSNLQELFNRMTNSCITEPCKHCGSDEVNCYLINQAALVIVSSGGEKEVGQSLKEIRCPLVEHMVNVSVLKQQYLYDFQGICIQVTHAASSIGSRLLAPFQHLMRIMLKTIQQLLIVAIGLIEPLNPLPIFGQDWSLYREPFVEDDRERLPSVYDRRFYSENSQASQYNGQSQPLPLKQNPFTYSKERVYPQQEASGTHLTNSEEGGASSASDVSLPSLPPLEMDSDGISVENKTDNSEATQNQVKPELEVQEEPTDDILGRVDQDPYEAQRRALEAIEKCRSEQTRLVLTNSDGEQDDNITESSSKNKTDRPVVPGTLLDCIHKSIQQRCRSSAGTSSLTGRYACEAVCEIVRERMPQLAGKIDDCRQPLTSCTERFVAFQVAPRWAPQTESPIPIPSQNSFQSNEKLPKEYIASGEYCQECGTRRWYLKPIEGTNLFFLVDYATAGASSVSCECKCQKIFRYGAEIKIDPSKPKPVRLRQDPPSPESCTIIKASLENSTVCTDEASKKKIQWNVIILIMLLHLIMN